MHRSAVLQIADHRNRQPVHRTVLAPDRVDVEQGLKLFFFFFKSFYSTENYEVSGS